jgi:outer membrane lipoprotein SlyB
MMRTLGVGAFLALAAFLPAQQAAAQDPIGGAIVGGALGGIIGGAIGRGAPGGIIAGAVIGAATGAAIASEAQQRNGYYWWHNGCYYRYPNGAWAQVYPNYCGY